MADQSNDKTTFEAKFDEQGRPVRPIARPRPGQKVTPEMRAIAEALAHPDGDPYLNGRKMGFYCENCG